MAHHLNYSYQRVALIVMKYQQLSFTSFTFFYKKIKSKVERYC